MANRSEIKLIRNLIAIGLASAALATALPSLEVLAAPRTSCERTYSDPLLSAPPAIPRFESGRTIPEKVTDPARLAREVKVHDLRTPGAAAWLARLKDGNYVYLIDGQGRLALVNRLMIPRNRAESSQILGSHDGLYARLRSMDPERRELSVLSAGEILVRDGKVFSINNKAGSRRGSAENLDFGARMLRKAGLKTDRETKVLDVASGMVVEPHANDARTARIELELLKDPAGRELWAETRRAMRKLRDSEADLFDAMDAYERGHPEFTAGMQGYLMQLVGMWRKGQDSEAYILNAFRERPGDAALRNLIRHLDAMASEQAAARRK